MWGKSMSDDKFKQWMGFAKFFLGTFVVGIITVIVNHQIQSRELELKELDKLGNYIEHALEENVGVRKRFSQYFATVTRSDALRERWKEYYSLVEIEYQSVIDEKNKKKELERKLQEAHLKGGSVGIELAAVRSQILSLERELFVERQKKEIERKVAAQVYWHKEGFTLIDTEKLRIKLEKNGIPTAIMQHVDPKPPDSIFIGALVNAIDARLILTSIPYEIKYLFPLTYSRIEGGDPEGLLVGIGYDSTHGQAHRTKDNTPIPLSKEQYNSLIEPGLSNTEFQIRLRRIAGP